MCLDMFSVKVGLFSQLINDVTCTTPVQSMSQLWYYIEMLKIICIHISEEQCEMVLLEG